MRVAATSYLRGVGRVMGNIALAHLIVAVFGLGGVIFVSREIFLALRTGTLHSQYRGSAFQYSRFTDPVGYWFSIVFYSVSCVVIIWFVLHIYAII
jgi:hypothetical protein